MSDIEYCARQVRLYDSDRYVTALFAPADRRADLLALYAFNLEVASSREMVSEPWLGRIRLQWWRDAVEECYHGAARRHQVAQPLAAAIRAYGLDRDLFNRLIDARESDMDAERPDRLEQVIAYADDTGGGLNQLALQVLGVADDDLGRVARGIGRAWALTGTIRGLKHLLLSGRHPLPADLMEECGLGYAALTSLKQSDSLRKVVARIAEIASQQLEECRVVRGGAAHPVLLQAALARGYLKRLADTGYNPYDRRNVRPLAGRVWRLMLPALTGRI